MEKQKIFWVVLSVSIFIVIVLVVGVFLLKQNPASEAETVNPISNTVTHMFEFDRQPGTTPAVQTQQGAQGGPSIVEPSPSEPEILKLIIGEGAQAQKPPETLPQPTLPPPTTTAAPQAATPQAPAAPQAGPSTAVAQHPAGEASSQARPAAAPAQKPAAAPAQKPAQGQGKPKAAPSTRRVVEYWIQTGSYKSQTLAEDLSRSLSERGLGARVFSYNVGKDMYFRVRIGPYSNRSEAGKFLSLVKQIEGLESSYISSVTSVRTVN